MANKGDDTITSFVLNAGTGELTAVGAPVASGGTMGQCGSMVVDAKENYLFVGNEITSDISVFSIAADGVLTPVAGSPFAIGDAADGMTLNIVGTILYVLAPNTNTLIVLSVAADGSLAPIAGSPFAYTAGGSITSFALSSSTLGLSTGTGGVLSSFSLDALGAPTLVESIAAAGGQAVTTARKGKLAIVSGPSTAISVVQVASNGTLTEVAGSPFATTFATVGYAVANPSSKYLFATEWDFASPGRIEAFFMNSAGALTPINNYPLTNDGVPTGIVIY